MKLLIYSPQITSRLSYTLRLIFGNILGIEFESTDNPEYFISSTSFKLSYCRQSLCDEIFIQSTGLLFETGVYEQEISVSEYKDCKIFFRTGLKSALPFDLFAASFFLVTRYEEFLPHRRDKYDRFEASESISQQSHFLKKPVVNIWAYQLKEIIQNRYPEFEFPQKKYKYISTIDIDNAYAYLEKGYFRTLGSTMRSLLNLDFEELVQRIKVLSGLETDPYDTYKFQLDIQKKFKLECIYFFLVGDYGLNDKNVPFQSVKLQSLIKTIADYADVGVHPSYGSNLNSSKIKTEIERIAHIIHRDVTKSRQHFLKLHFPHTYRNLIELDITDDYTMGYAAQTGFRAGICLPYKFYDVDMESETNLTIHPFTVMDATLNYYMKFAPESAITHIKTLVDEVKAVNGTFVSLWHNETLSDQKKWKDWRKVYEEMVEYASN